MKYMKCQLDDFEDSDISVFFKSGWEFMENAYSENPNNKIFVHCAQGKSRSATMICLFLMKLKTWSF